MKQFSFNKWLDLLPKTHTILDLKVSDFNTDDKTLSEDNVTYITIQIREEKNG
tara:strand:- start:1299 stop:1457 length:159 start_codon:yes stop_codon:yes gene_type:complete